MTAHCKPEEATSEMVERVALGIANARRARYGIGAALWEHLTDEEKTEHVAYAQVAIAAMWEPTEAMIDSGDHDDYDPRLVWQIMIDEALK